MTKLRALFLTKVLSPKGIWSLLSSVLNGGINLNTILDYCSKMYPKRVALVQDNIRLTYKQLHKNSLNLASNLITKYSLKHRDNVALISRNNIELVTALFAISKTGANIFLLNPEMSSTQLSKICAENNFDLLIHDEDTKELILNSFKKERTLPLKEKNGLSITSLIQQNTAVKIKKRKSGYITILTGGTGGEFKPTYRNQSALNFLTPLSALINDVKLYQYKSTYIPIPIFHGFGLASLIVSILLGTEIHLTQKFNTKEACNLIKKYNIEVLSIVPTMLNRMLSKESDSLKSLKRIISGGAILNPTLISSTTNQLGEIIYNLYGTTEAGFCILATPEQLNTHPNTIGKAIKGVKLKTKSNKEVSTLEIKSNWAMNSLKNKWIDTGDLATINEASFIFLKGRKDDMIVSGGENVYPKDLEDIICTHIKINEVAVIGVSDNDFGQRLKAFVTIKPHETTTAEELKDWLKNRVPRYQMPIKIIILDQLPFTSAGKVDKRFLKHG